MTTRPKNPSKISSLISSHGKIARSCLRELLATPLSTAVTFLVIAFALLLPGLLYLISVNINASAGELNTPARVSVYLESNLSEVEAIDVSSHLQTTYAT